jgi:hypothetical protein
MTAQNIKIPNFCNCVDFFKQGSACWWRGGEDALSRRRTREDAMRISSQSSVKPGETIVGSRNRDLHQGTKGASCGPSAPAVGPLSCSNSGGARPTFFAENLRLQRFERSAISSQVDNFNPLSYPSYCLAEWN